MQSTNASPVPGQSFFSLSPDLLSVLDLSGHFVHVNPAHETLLGYDPASLVGQHYRVIIHKDDLPLIETELGRLREVGTVHGVEVRCHDARGDEHWLEVSAQLSEDGLIYSVARNITERKQLTAEKNTLERRLATTLSSMTDAFFMLDKEWRFTYINPVGEKTLNIPAESLLGQTLWASFPQVAGTAFEQHYRQAMTSGEAVEFEACYDPFNLWIEVHAYPSKDGLAVYFRDINDRVFAQRHMRLLERSIGASINGVLIVDAQAPDYPLIFVNPAFERITGYSSQEVVGRNCRFLQGPHTSEESRRRLREAVVAGREAHVIIGNYRKDGGLFWNELYIAPVWDEQGVLTHFVGIQNDISTLQESRDQLAWNSHHDALTGLPNLALFRDRLQQAAAMPRTPGARLAVLTVNLDHFRQLREDVGTENTDEIVLTVARRLKTILWPSATLARVESDEFALLIPERNLAAIDVLAEQVLRVVKEPIAVGNERLQLTASIGLVISNESSDDPAELLRQVGVATQHAKRSGRNQVVRYSPEMAEPLEKRNELRRGLQLALAEDQFALMYQPQINAGTGQIIGVEVLMRWQHPAYGSVPPDQFIPLAETSGLIAQLTDWLVGRLIVEMRELLPWCDRDMRFGINVSPLLLRDPEFSQRLMEALTAAGVGPKRIEIELTENILLDLTESLTQLLQNLRRAGFRIAIDDFGTGFSGLSYLKNLPIDTLKIDRTFVRDIVQDGRDSTIVDSVVYLARHMNMTVIAEGVEEPAQAIHLSRAGVHVFQGFLFARPMNRQDLVRFMTAGGPRPGYVALPGEPIQARPRVLVVDGDVATRSALGRLFRKSALDIKLVGSYEEALTELALAETRLLICDLIGRSVAFQGFMSTVRKRYPGLRTLVLSGTVSIETVTDAINTGAVYRYLTKPWSDARLMEEVYQACELSGENNLQVTHEIL